MGVGGVSHEFWKWELKERRTETQPQKLGFSHRTCVMEKDWKIELGGKPQ